MENYQGDLTDILRGGVGIIGSTTTITAAKEATAVQDWKFPSNPKNYSSSRIEQNLDDFGDPFSNMGDPLLDDIEDMPTSPMFLTSPSTNNTSILSRMLQISPTTPSKSPGVVGAVSSNTLLISSDTSNSKGCLVENAGLQISSPRSTGIKRRKSQAKKVVCIPAPAPANSKSSGEIVPSDLWAWRKYGQKPIKGSPFPRGYYRCSSSKGCSARKQVERSRTDPTMLVITYTCDHNHPWPTQRNALAGSTRSQPTKNNNNSTTKSSSSSASQSQELQMEDKKESNDINTNNIVSYSAVKEEKLEDFQKKIEMEDNEFGRAFVQSYKPTLPDSMQNEDFFADLGEIGIDPLNLLFTQGFSGDEGGGNKALNPFSFYD